MDVTFNSSHLQQLVYFPVQTNETQIQSYSFVWRRQTLHHLVKCLDCSVESYQHCKLPSQQSGGFQRWCLPWVMAQRNYKWEIICDFKYSFIQTILSCGHRLKVSIFSSYNKYLIFGRRRMAKILESISVNTCTGAY